MLFEITVSQVVPDCDLDSDDAADNPSGSYSYEADSEDDALDEFHCEVPIACLDHFDITVEAVDGLSEPVAAVLAELSAALPGLPQADLAAAAVALVDAAAAGRLPILDAARSAALKDRTD